MVRSRGFNQHQDMIVEYVRWVMVNKRDPSAPAPDPVMPQLAPVVAPADLVPPPSDLAEGTGMLDSAQSGSDKYFDDYETGMFIDHHDGVTLEDSEHMLATRAYQNTARVHFDGLAQQETRFGKRLIYGGHIISHARAMSFNGLENAVCVAGLNAGTHAAPAFAGDTIYAGTRIIDKATLAGVERFGALRLRHFVMKNKPVGDIAELVSNQETETRPDDLLLDLDCWVWMVRR
jgi:2-methylfumaryl-CoA hydratase